MERREKRERSLADLCQFLKGVGPARAQRLRKLGIETVEDVLTHFPRTYYDRRNLSKIKDLNVGEETCFLGQILTVAQPRGRHGRRSRIAAAVGDNTGIVQVVWFNQPYLAKRLKSGTRYVLSGRVSNFRGRRSLDSPHYEELLPDASLEQLTQPERLFPVYPLTDGITQQTMRRVVREALARGADAVQEALPADLLRRNNLLPPGLPRRRG